VGTGRGSQSELIESDGLTAGSDDASTCSRGESESSDGDLWNFVQTDVIGDGADDDNGLSCCLCFFVSDVLVDSGEGNWWSVDLGHEQAAEDDLVEVGVGSASQEPVKFDQKSDVWIFTLRGLSVARPEMMCLQIDTHCD